MVHGRLAVLLDAQVQIRGEVVRYEQREDLVKGLHAEAQENLKDEQLNLQHLNTGIYDDWRMQQCRGRGNSRIFSGQIGGRREGCGRRGLLRTCAQLLADRRGRFQRVDAARREARRLHRVQESMHGQVLNWRQFEGEVDALVAECVGWLSAR